MDSFFAVPLPEVRPTLHEILHSSTVSRTALLLDPLDYVIPDDSLAHWFGEDLICPCGMSFSDFAKTRQPCQLAAKDNTWHVPVEFRSGVQAYRQCRRGHPKTEEHGQHVSTARGVRWRCETCRDIMREKRESQRLATKGETTG